MTETMNITMTAEDNQIRIVNIPTDKLQAFEEHPFKVEENADMQSLIESIRDNGILTPFIVRPVYDDKYEIVSGHRRLFACNVLGITEVPAVVKDLSREEAVIEMVDSNLHRERILPSEKAFAYKMKINVLRKQGKRTDLTSSQNEPKLRSDEQIAKENNESRATVQRYIRLTRLIPELLQLVDEGRIALGHGVEIATFEKKIQRVILDVYQSEERTPNLSQIVKLKRLQDAGALSEEAAMEILLEDKANQVEKVSFRYNDIQRYFPRSYTPKQITDTILGLLDKWKKDRDRREERD